MFLWFAGLSMVLVWAVFRSPAVDYRLVAFGAVLPIVELAAGRPAVLHTLIAPVAVMTLVMVGYRGRRIDQRQLLGVPIGLFLHLVLDGVWSDASPFWWPFTGWTFADKPLPELDRGGLTLVMEAAGAVALWWWWRRWRLGEPERRRLFLRSGRVGRDLAAEVAEMPKGPAC